MAALCLSVLKILLANERVEDEKRGKQTLPKYLKEVPSGADLVESVEFECSVETQVSASYCRRRRNGERRSKLRLYA